MARSRHVVLVTCWFLCAASQAVAQFGETPSTGGPVLGAERTQRWKVGHDRRRPSALPERVRDAARSHQSGPNRT